MISRRTPQICGATGLGSPIPARRHMQANRQEAEVRSTLGARLGVRCLAPSPEISKDFRHSAPKEESRTSRRQSYYLSEGLILLQVIAGDDSELRQRYNKRPRTQQFDQAATNASTLPRSNSSSPQLVNKHVQVPQPTSLLQCCSYARFSSLHNSQSCHQVAETPRNLPNSASGAFRRGIHQHPQTRHPPSSVIHHHPYTRLHHPQTRHPPTSSNPPSINIPIPAIHYHPQFTMPRVSEHLVAFAAAADEADGNNNRRSVGLPDGLQSRRMDTVLDSLASERYHDI